jgi:hypothetical protein
MAVENRRHFVVLLKTASSLFSSVFCLEVFCLS